MALPVTPNVETILRSCVATLNAEIVPELTSDWGRYSGRLVAASLEYALKLLSEPEAPAQRTSRKPRLPVSRSLAIDSP